MGRKAVSWNYTKPSSSAAARLKPGERFSVILELKGVSAAVFAKKWNLQALSWITVPGLYESPQHGVQQATFCTASVTQEFVTQMETAGSPLQKDVRRYAACVPREVSSPIGIEGGPP